MKKFIILSFMFLFFAGINNNANAQTYYTTTVVVDYVWHCTPNPDAKVYANLDGHDVWDELRHEHIQTGLNDICSGYSFKDLTVTIDVSGNFAWAHVTETKSEIPYIRYMYVTVDIYDGPPQTPRL